MISEKFYFEKSSVVTKKRLQYKLRPRNHDLALTRRTSYYDSCNLITRMILTLHMFLLLYFNLRSVVAYRTVIVAINHYLSIYLLIFSRLTHDDVTGWADYVK